MTNGFETDADFSLTVIVGIYANETCIFVFDRHFFFDIVLPEGFEATETVVFGGDNSAFIGFEDEFLFFVFDECSESIEFKLSLIVELFLDVFDFFFNSVHRLGMTYVEGVSVSLC